MTATEASSHRNRFEAGIRDGNDVRVSDWAFRLVLSAKAQSGCVETAEPTKMPGQSDHLALEGANRGDYPRRARTRFCRRTPGET